MSIKLSIVTVARNALADLKKTVASLAEFDRNLLELIVIDGASTDGSREYLETVQGSQLRFISESDTGIYNAMNKGIRLARGEFIYFLNAGDVLSSHTALVHVLKRLHEADVYYCDVYLEENGERRLRKYYKQISLGYWLREYMCHQAVFFRRALFDELGLYEERYRFAADYDFLLHAWTAGKKFEHIDVAIATYDMHGASSQPKNAARVLAEYAKIQTRRLGLLQRIYRRCLMLANDPTPAGSSLLFRVRRKFERKFFRTFFEYRTSIEFFFAKGQVPKERALRVAHLSSYTGSGGAAVAAVRLHHGLQELGVNSQVLSVYASSPDRTLVHIGVHSGMKKRMAGLLSRAESLLKKVMARRRAGLHSPGLFALHDPKHLWAFLELFDPDVVHLHWFNHGFMTIKDIARIKQPIVWTFHDMWPMLGMEHISTDDQHLRGFPNAPLRQVPDRLIWLHKVKHWTPLKARTSVVCPSRWMREQALKNPLWADADIRVIGNSVPTSTFFPLDKGTAREILQMTGEYDQVFIFGAASPFGEPVKGYDQFMKALAIFLEGKRPERTLVITFGDSAGMRMVPGVKHRHFDLIKSLEFLRVLYSAADVLVVSSFVESFCLVAAEAQACGRPVVCFDTAGLKDVVDHQVTGYRAKLGDVADFANGMSWILEDNVRYHQLCLNAREQMDARFDVPVIAEEHLRLYRKVAKMTELGEGRPVTETRLQKPLPVYQSGIAEPVEKRVTRAESVTYM